MNDFTISTDLVVPRDDTSTGVPYSWITDDAVSLEARGFLFEVLTWAQPGRPCRASNLNRHPLDPPTENMLGHLVSAGYLIPDGDDNYRLVHPDRLPPLPVTGKE